MNASMLYVMVIHPNPHHIAYLYYMILICQHNANKNVAHYENQRFEYIILKSQSFESAAFCILSFIMNIYPVLTIYIWNLLYTLQL